MKMFRVPQREVPVIVELRDGSERRGHLYASASGPGGRPGRLIDRLNDDEERFLPLTDGGRGWLLNKDWIVRVAVDVDHRALELESEAGAHRVEVRFEMASGSAIEGTVFYTMPPDKQRLLDYLNSEGRFIPLRHDGGAWLINRDHITQVTNRSDGAESG